ncbi:MAG: hypothetical protein IIX42_04955, partial [Alistipes sp.]|nr:hypothetical protein [Alistipes sp.]
MNRALLALFVMLCTSCGGNETPSGPDWGKLPQKPDNTPTTTIITPTTATAPENEDITGLQYTPGMQINVDNKTFSTRLDEVAKAGFKYVELKIKYSYGLHNYSADQISATFADMQRQMESKGIIVWSIHLPYEDKNWTSISAKESIRTQSVDYILRALRLCAAAFPTCKNYVL